MMFHTSHKKLKNYENQTGVSLMLAVLILSAITAVSFSVATIVFIEIRSSGNSLRTEPNLYATLGVTEEALFQYKRGYEPNPDSIIPEFDVPNCGGPNGSNVCFINNVTLTLPPPQPLEFDTNPRVEYIAPNSTKIIPMYRNLKFQQEYSQIDMQVFPNQSDTELEVLYVKTNAQGIKQCYPGGTGDPWPCDVTSIVPIAPDKYTFNGFTPGNQPDADQFELTIKNNSLTQGVSVSIITKRYNALPGEPDGLPFTAKKVLRIVADYLGLTRSYQVEIPTP